MCVAYATRNGTRDNFARTRKTRGPPRRARKALGRRSSSPRPPSKYSRKSVPLGTTDKVPTRTLTKRHHVTFERTAAPHLTRVGTRRHGNRPCTRVCEEAHEALVHDRPLGRGPLATNYLFPPFFFAHLNMTLMFCEPHSPSRSQGKIARGGTAAQRRPGPRQRREARLATPRTGYALSPAQKGGRKRLRHVMPTSGDAPIVTACRRSYSSYCGNASRGITERP